MPRAARHERVPSPRGLALVVGVAVGGRVERDERLAGALLPDPQVGVERLLLWRRAPSRSGEHTVKAEQTRAQPSRQPTAVPSDRSVAGTGPPSGTADALLLASG